MKPLPDYRLEEEESVRVHTRTEPDQKTFEEELQEARDFHDEWSRQNPNRVYGYSYPKD